MPSEFDKFPLANPFAKFSLAPAVAPTVAEVLQPQITRQPGFSPEAPTARPPVREDASILDAILATPSNQPQPWWQAAVDRQRSLALIADPPPGGVIGPSEAFEEAGFTFDDPGPGAVTRLGQAVRREALIAPAEIIAMSLGRLSELVGAEDQAEGFYRVADDFAREVSRNTEPGTADTIGGFVGFLLNPMLAAAFGVGGKISGFVLKVLGGKLGPPTVDLLVKHGRVSKETAERITRFVGWSGEAAGPAAFGLGTVDGLEGFASTGTIKGTIDGIIKGVATGASIGLLFRGFFGATRVLQQTVTDAVARHRLGLPQTGKLTADQLKDAFINKALEAHPARGGTDEAFMLVSQAFERLAIRAKLVEALRVPVRAAQPKTVPPPVKPTKPREQPPTASRADIELHLAKGGKGAGERLKITQTTKLERPVGVRYTEPGKPQLKKRGEVIGLGVGPDKTLVAEFRRLDGTTFKQELSPTQARRVLEQARGRVPSAVPSEVEPLPRARPPKTPKPLEFRTKRISKPSPRKQREAGTFPSEVLEGEQAPTRVAQAAQRLLAEAKTAQLRLTKAEAAFEKATAGSAVKNKAGLPTKKTAIRLKTLRADLNAKNAAVNKFRKKPGLPAAVVPKPARKATPAQTTAANKVDMVELRSQAKKEGVFVTERSTRGQIEDGIRRNKEFKKNPPVRRGLIDIGLLTDLVNAGVQGGKWALDNTKAAARWLWYTQGGEVSKLAALKALIAKFGEPIRKRFPRIWGVFSRTIRGTGRGIADFFAGAPKVGTGRLSSRPASVKDVAAFIKGVETAKPLRKEFEAMKVQERADRAAEITEISERLGGREGVFAALRSQKGEFARPERTFEPMTTVSGTQLDSLVDHITFHEFGGAPQSRLHMKKVVINMVENGYLPTDGEIQLLETLFGSEMMKAILRRKYSKTRRAIRVALDLWNTPKSLLASWDVSAVGRQGLPETLAHPLYATKAGGQMMRAFASESFTQKVSRDMRKDIHFDPAISDGLFLPSVFGSVDIMSREEAFLGRIIQNIPIIRAMVRPSERSFITYLNLMRLNAYKQGVSILELAKVPRTWNGGKSGGRSDDYHRLALFINAATGRGNIGLGDLGAFLNGALFSPRLMFSHFEYPVRSLGAVTQTGVRNVVVRQMVAVNIYMATIMGMLKLLNQLQPELNIRIEDKWTSSRFGKVLIGKNTSIDILGGRARVFSLLTQVASASYTNKKGKRVERNPLFSATWYVAGRLAPAPQALLSARMDERFGGKSLDVIDLPFTDKNIEFPFAGLIPDLIVPITLQNIQEVTDEHDMTGLWLMLPEVVGEGVAVTPSKESVAGRGGRSRSGRSRSGRTRKGRGR